MEEKISKTFQKKVPFYKLDELVDFRNGKGHEKNIVDEGEYIVVNSKFISTDGEVKKYSNEQISPLFYNDILMVMSDLPNGRALAKCFIVDKNNKYTLNQRICALKVKNEDILSPKYLYYFLNRNRQLLKYDNGVDQTNLRKDDILNIKIAIPPIEVQREIVHILETFTLLSTTLSDELNARQKQFEYYVEELLSNIDANIVSVGEACEVITDYVAAGSFGDIAKNVKYLNEPNYAQLVRTVDIKNKFKKSDYVYVDEKAFNYLWRVNLNTECVILPNIGVNCGEVYYITPKDLIYENNVLGPNAILLRSSKNNNRYLSYIFKTQDFQKQLRKIISPAGQTKFNKTELKKLKIKLPNIDVQEKIVNKIEKMDKIVNDISEGIPAEIEARQKQFEYYKDVLLNFKEVESYE